MFPMFCQFSSQQFDHLLSLYYPSTGGRGDPASKMFDNLYRQVYSNARHYWKVFLPGPQLKQIFFEGERYCRFNHWSLVQLNKGLCHNYIRQPLHKRYLITNRYTGWQMRMKRMSKCLNFSPSEMRGSPDGGQHIVTNVRLNIVAVLERVDMCLQ